MTMRGLAVTALLATVAACTVEIPVTDDPTLRSCYQMCDASAHGAGCTDPDSSEYLCTVLCDEMFADVSVECRDEAKSFWACRANLTWECPGGDPEQPADADECWALGERWETCEP